MAEAIVVGGSNGLGFAILRELTKNYDAVLVFDIVKPLESFNNVKYFYFDLSKDPVHSLKEAINNADTLVITAGIGQVKPFDKTDLIEVEKILKINTVSTIGLIKLFYSNLLYKKDAKCLVVSSIAGEVVSPLNAVYGSSKAAISKLCESLNIELEKSNSSNRITCVEATALKGTSFYGEKTDCSLLEKLALDLISELNDKQTLVYVNPGVCKEIIEKYNQNRYNFGLESYEYKMKSGRLSNKKAHVIGYLSGTFDLFHIGHLNLLRRAKERCDYLIVGVHKDGSWKGKETFIPFDERLDIIRSIKYVDEAEESFVEDIDAWEKHHFDKLFVGSDYKGSERFKRYEEFFKDKGVEIVYFPYTKGTCSTQLREKILNK